MGVTEALKDPPLLAPVSALTVAAPHAGALADGGLLERAGAGRAGLAAATVDRQLLDEIAGIAVRADEVAQGGAALADRGLQHATDLHHQSLVALAGDLPGRTQWRDPGRKQGF